MLKKFNELVQQKKSVQEISAELQVNEKTVNKLINCHEFGIMEQITEEECKKIFEQNIFPRSLSCKLRSVNEKKIISLTKSGASIKYIADCLHTTVVRIYQIRAEMLLRDPELAQALHMELLTTNEKEAPREVSIKPSQIKRPVSCTYNGQNYLDVTAFFTTG